MSGRKRLLATEGNNRIRIGLFLKYLKRVIILEKCHIKKVKGQINAGAIKITIAITVARNDIELSESEQLETRPIFN